MCFRRNDIYFVDEQNLIHHAESVLRIGRVYGWMRIERRFRNTKEKLPVCLISAISKMLPRGRELECCKAQSSNCEEGDRELHLSQANKMALRGRI